MAGPKTTLTRASAADFLNGIPDPQVREDCWTIANIMQDAAKAKPEMWGPNIVGFGRHRMVYANGSEADWMLIAFSPRKQNITLYIMDGIDSHGELMSNLGTHSCGKGCLYIKRLSDIHLPTLRNLVHAAVQHRISGRSQA